MCPINAEIYQSFFEDTDWEISEETFMWSMWGCKIALCLKKVQKKICDWLYFYFVGHRSWKGEILCSQHSFERWNGWWKLWIHLCSYNIKSDGNFSTKCCSFAMWSRFPHWWQAGVLQSNCKRWVLVITYI